MRGKRVVIDTNVLIAANGNASHGGAACAAASARALVEAMDGSVCEDVEGRIFSEWKRYVSFSGQPGVGDRFFGWFVRNRYIASQVVRVSVQGDEDNGLWPGIPDSLQSMDRMDKKYVGVYLVAEADLLLNATDSDWSEVAEELLAVGVTVLELCS